MKQIEKSKKIAECVYLAMHQKSASDIKVLDVMDITTLADIFIIATASNSRLAAALADEVEEKLKEEGYQCMAKEGYQTARWILLDCEGVMVHIFHEEEAAFYKLDRLWSDGKEINFNIK